MHERKWTKCFVHKKVSEVLITNKGKDVPVFVQHNKMARGEKPENATHIINLDTAWTLVIFTLRPFYTPGKEPKLHVRYNCGWSPEQVST